MTTPTPPGADSQQARSRPPLIGRVRWLPHRAAASCVSVHDGLGDFLGALHADAFMDIA